MEATEEEDDLRLAKASAGLLSDLETCIPKILWKSSKATSSRGPVHSRVRRKDLDYIINLIEPFQGEPQLLDARLKYILPPLVEAYLEYLKKPSRPDSGQHVDLQTALATVLYTLCKVRGTKVIVSFLDNQPRHLELVLLSLQDVSFRSESDESADWKVPYVLLLWVSHLLLAPFDLASISSHAPVEALDPDLKLRQTLPCIAQWIINLGLAYLPSSTKTQDAAASLLVRLVTRPDMQKLQLGDALVDHTISRISPAADIPTLIYTQLGPLRFLSSLSTSADLIHLAPKIYNACASLCNDEAPETPISTNAVGKRLLVKALRNIAILFLRTSSSDAANPHLNPLESLAVLEEAIDFMLRSLGDRDTPVRFAAAKALSLTILEMHPDMGHEVVQAVLDTFKEDMPSNAQELDYTTANALKWHGLTLTLAHALFKRSAAVSQLPEIVEALVSALNFEQRTATGSSVGTNVRDAANFGIWSLSRRYSTAELLQDPQPRSFATDIVSSSDGTPGHVKESPVQAIATQLLLSACLDPAGNVRRGSSAALQELIGRHPNEVAMGISLVQIVDYQAVGLRQRALINVAVKASRLEDCSYGRSLKAAILGWRGTGSPDILSREAAAESFAQVSTICNSLPEEYLAEDGSKLTAKLHACSKNDVEYYHGTALTFAKLLHRAADAGGRAMVSSTWPTRIWSEIKNAGLPSAEFTTRAVRADFPAAIATLAAAVCRSRRSSEAVGAPDEAMIAFTERLLLRHEESILVIIPYLVQQLLLATRAANGALGFLGAKSLGKQVATDGSKATPYGAGRAVALGALVPYYASGLTGEAAFTAISTLASLLTSHIVDRRIFALRALSLALSPTPYSVAEPDSEILGLVSQAVHTGLNDHTLDSRGDIGSLVRLQALTCYALLSPLLSYDSPNAHILHADILRLSLEKLDRVRSKAAQVRAAYIPAGLSITSDVAQDVGSETYLHAALSPLTNAELDESVCRALLYGLLSSAGAGNEALLQISRKVLAQYLSQMLNAQLCHVLTIYATVLKDLLSTSDLPHGNNGALVQPALALLAFLLEMGLPQRLLDPAPAPATTSAELPSFKWRALLSTVQKSHHKSADLPRLVSAINVYRGLAEVAAIRTEVLKKLLSMLRTNPYPKIRVAVAEALWMTIRDESLKGRDWGGRGKEEGAVIESLVGKYIMV